MATTAPSKKPTRAELSERLEEARIVARVLLRTADDYTGSALHDRGRGWKDGARRAEAIARAYRRSAEVLSLVLDGQDCFQAFDAVDGRREA